MAMWDFKYRTTHTQNKPNEKLVAEGWEQDCEGNWCHKKMEKARSRAFMERNRELVLKIVEGHVISFQ